MAIDVPTKAEILNDAQGYLKARKPSMSVSSDTDFGARIKAVIEALYGLHVNARNVEKDIFATTASGTALEEHAKTRLGLNPLRSATVSSGTDALRVWGTLNSTVRKGATLSHSDGTRYQITEALTIPAALFIDVSVESISTGTQCNKAANETLTFEMPPDGITADTTLQSALTGGLDVETSAELRERLIHAYQNPPAGGRFADYWAWAMSISSIEAAYIYGPNSADADGRRGLGTVDVVITKTGTGSARVPSAALVEDVQDYIDDNYPALADVEVMAPGTTNVDIDIQVDVNVGYEFDWSGSGVVQSYADQVITWTAALPSGLTDVIDAGDTARIMCANQVFTVISYTGQTTTINETPTTNPASPDPIYPAGPVSQDVLDAVIDYIDGLGPAKGTAGDPNQLNWDDVLRCSRLCDECIDAHIGVKDVTLVDPDPSTDWTQTPTDPGDPSAPNMYVYNEILIRPV